MLGIVEIVKTRPTKLETAPTAIFGVGNRLEVCRIDAQLRDTAASGDMIQFQALGDGMHPALVSPDVGRHLALPAPERAVLMRRLAHLRPRPDPAPARFA